MDFVKNEIRPNYIKYVKKYGIKSALICGKFKEGDLKFSWPFNFIANSILKFDYILVQDQESKKIIENFGHNNTFICGDTRFDRVMNTLDNNNSIKYINEFKMNNKCIVAGSIWEGDQSIIVDYINTCKENTKFILAPHEIDKNKINSLRNSINKKSILYSELSYDNINLDVLIIDNVGMLARLYKYADIAYVGGGFSQGVHNTLEPAAYGNYMLFGPKHTHFPETYFFIENQVSSVINSKQEFEEKVHKYIMQGPSKESVLNTTQKFLNKNTQDVDVIINHIKKHFT